MSDNTSLLAILEQRLDERAVLRDPADQARYLSDWACRWPWFARPPPPSSPR